MNTSLRVFIWYIILRSIGLLLTAATDASVLLLEGETESADPEQLTIISRNLYLGASIFVLSDPLNSFESIHEVVRNFYMLVQATDYPSRAKVIAQEILERQADVVCLQEVLTYSFSESSDGSNREEDLDYLDILMSELGSDYNVASVVRTTIAILPYESEGGNPEQTSRFLIAEDSNAIVTRSGVPVLSASSQKFSTVTKFFLASNQPCIIDLERGFCWIETALGDTRLIITNSRFDSALYTANQLRQARELLVNVANLTSNGQEAVLVGGFDAEPPTLSVSNCSGVTADVYSLLSCDRFDPFAAEDKPTWGTDDELRNLVPDLKRIDHIFTPLTLYAEAQPLFGLKPKNELNGMFPSDHFGLECVIGATTAIRPEEDMDEDISSCASSRFSNVITFVRAGLAYSYMVVLLV